MMSIESSFDEYREQLSKMLHDKVDPFLALRIMYLERRLPEYPPKLELDVKVRDFNTAASLKESIREKFGFEVGRHKDHLSVVGLANIEKLEKLAATPNIEWITGSASPAPG